MRLGSQTGSLTNHLYSRAVIGQPEVTVGMGATILCWTDRHAATVVAVEQVGKQQIITVQRDIAKRTDKNGFSEDQDYLFVVNPEGAKSHFRKLNDGRWQEVYKNATTGRWNKYDGGSGLKIGFRESYHDYTF